MSRPEALAVILATCFLLLISGFIGGAFVTDIGQISHENQTAVTPADYAFLIWNFIWTLQGVSVVWLLLRQDPSLAGIKKGLVNGVAPWWIAGFLSELLWFLLFSLDRQPFQLLSTCCLLIGSVYFLGSLFLLEDSPPGVTSGFSLSFGSVMSCASAANAAWLTVASAVGIVMQSPNADKAVALGALVVGGTVCLSLWVIYRTKSVTYALTLIWALVAVYVGQPDFPAVRIAAIAYAVVVALAGAWALHTRIRSNDQFDVEFDLGDPEILHLNPPDPQALQSSPADDPAAGVFAADASLA